MKNILSLNNIEKTKTTETEFFAKCCEKCKFVGNFGNKGYTFDDYACPKVQNLNFKDEQYDWRCSNYPFCYAKSLHCAERKAFAYETWRNSRNRNQQEQKPAGTETKILYNEHTIRIYILNI